VRLMSVGERNLSVHVSSLSDRKEYAGRQLTSGRGTAEGRFDVCIISVGLEPEAVHRTILDPW